MSENKKSLTVIILAAGKGTRMKSSWSKMINKVAGLEMVNHVVMAAEKLNANQIIAVCSPEMPEVEKAIYARNKNVKIVYQHDRNGTGGAVKVAVQDLDDLGENVLVMYGDVPLIAVETYQSMVDSINDENNSSSVLVLGFHTGSIKNKYGRLIHGVGNILERITEYKDAVQAEREITLCNSGIVVIKGKILKELLNVIDNKNASNEYYLTDIVGIARKKGLLCTYVEGKEQEVMGVNSKYELCKAEAAFQNRKRKELMINGTTLMDPERVYFGYNTEIGKDVIIQPNVFFGSNVKIGNNVEIKSFSHIEDTVLEDDVTVGPFARLRSQTVLKKGSQVCNFVEVARSTIGEDTMANHLTCIVDAEIGKNVNIGAGTITCNYDGFNKFETKIGDNVLLGSNTITIAPVKIGDNAITAAGSVITQDVAENDLAISRSEQKNFQNKAIKYREKRKK